MSEGSVKGRLPKQMTHRQETRLESLLEDYGFEVLEHGAFSREALRAKDDIVEYVNNVVLAEEDT